MDDEKISEFRDQLSKALEVNDVASLIDQKDVHRLRTSDKYVMCFIFWRKGNVEAAVKMAIDVLKWRNERDINCLKVESISTDILKRGAVFVHGRALDDTRIVYFIARHQTKDIKVEVQKVLCLWLERLHHQETGKHVTFILDVSKTSMSNVDLGGIRFLMDCFITYFPNMLERIIILEMPWIMNAIWKVVKQWMTEEQRKKTAFLAFKELTQFVAPDNILKYMGGEDDWTYEYPPPIDDVPSLTEISNYELDDIESLQDPDEEEYVMDDVEITVAVATTLPPVISADASSEDSSAMASLQDVSASGDNVSMRTSTLPPSGKGDLDENVELKKEPQVRNSSSNRVPPPGVNLHSLLILSPISEIIFDHDDKDQRSGKYQSSLTLTNPNDAGEVAFKIKTNSPGRYHVKPSSGCIAAGESIKIRINLSTGFEDSVDKDRFLILYQKKDDDVDGIEFWKTHLSKDMHHEYRIRVKFHPSIKTKSSDANLSPEFSSSVPEVKTSSPEVEFGKIWKDISSVKYKLTSVETNMEQMRSKLKYSLILNCILLLLLLYVVHQISMVSMLVQYQRT